jgi:predicted transposase YbfD/YdcC
MYSTVSSLTLPALTSDERHRLLSQDGLPSLYAVFATIPDPRRKEGQRYELAFLLTCLVAALLCNCNSTLAVGQWCREQRPLLAQVFGPRRFLCPSDSLYRRLLPRLSAEHLEWAVADWVRATLTAAAAEPIALDGKAVRGARTDEHAAPHLLAFCTHDSQEILLQVRVDEKTNEIPVAQFLLPCLPVAGRVYTADALHTQTAFLALIRALHGHTVLTVKANQPSLYADLATYFTDPAADYQQATTTDYQRGRIEVRNIKVSTAMNDFLSTTWPGVRQVAQLTRTVTVRRTGKTTHETVYLITTLSPAQASPERLLALVRHHWCIENSLHYVRDVTFGEDRSRLRSGNAPQVMAAMRNLAITLIHRSGSFQIAETRRHFSYQPREALALLLPQRKAA